MQLNSKINTVLQKLSESMFVVPKSLTNLIKSSIVNIIFKLAFLQF